MPIATLRDALDGDGYVSRPGRVLLLLLDYVGMALLVDLFKRVSGELRLTWVDQTRLPVKYVRIVSLIRFRALMVDDQSEAPRKKALQSPGNLSKVYVPVITKIFKDRYRQGASSVIFSLDDVRNACDALGVTARNVGDLIYRMRSRTKLPKEILDLGFHVLRATGRGKYAFEKATSTIFEPPFTDPITIVDMTPMPVRRLLSEKLADMDEQAILTIASYCRVLDHLTGMTIYRLRSHVRKSVPDAGQVELDAIDVGIAKSEDDIPIVFPIEAKALADALNRVQIFNMVQYAQHYYPNLTVRPLAIKVDEASVLHVVEFNSPKKASDLKILKAASYIIDTSEAQKAVIRATNVPKQ
jgi:hypothetical protein